MKEEIFKVSEVVKQCLVEDSKCRNDDKWLILIALKKMGFHIVIPFDDMLYMPSFESITRCRRLLQEKNPDLRPSAETAERRLKNEKEMHEIKKWKNDV